MSPSPNQLSVMRRAPGTNGRCHPDSAPAIEHGDGQAAEQLLPLVYEELRKLAGQKMAQENPGQTLQATAPVHEAYVRLVDVKKAQHWDSRGHFFSAAAEAMRRILVEQAGRRRQRTPWLQSPA